MQQGDAQWEKAVMRLLGFHDSQYAAAAWFVQAPHITGKRVWHMLAHWCAQACRTAFELLQEKAPGHREARNGVPASSLQGHLLTTDVSILTITSGCVLPDVGALGPIPVADMAAWLLQGTAPKQLSRPCHKPLLDSVAADPSQLLVCGVLGAELQQVMMSGEAQRTVLACLPSLTMWFVCMSHANAWQTHPKFCQAFACDMLQEKIENVRLTSDFKLLLLQGSWCSRPCTFFCQPWPGVLSTRL